MLQEITDQFAPLMKRFAVYNLWEQKQTKLGPGVNAYVVEEDSAAPAWDIAERCGVFATHDGMNKFADVHDPGYRVVFEALARYIVSAPALIRFRWDKDQESLDHEMERNPTATNGSLFLAALVPTSLVDDIMHDSCAKS